MQYLAKDLEMTLTVKVKETGKVFTFRVPGRNKLVMLHPETKEEFLEVDLGTRSEPKVKFLGKVPQKRSAQTVGNCIKECAREAAQAGQDGIVSSAGCVVMCATTIFD